MLAIRKWLVFIFGLATLVGGVLMALALFSDPFMEEEKTFRLAVGGLVVWATSVVGLWASVFWLQIGSFKTKPTLSETDNLVVPPTNPSNGIGYVRSDVVDHLVRGNNNPPK
ncbi:MAG: hypothetical protein QG665_49 [Patescibacteria group bacterium]|nr:hypothetical protein [Patescibacteria group bacterium]